MKNNLLFAVTLTIGVFLSSCSDDSADQSSTISGSAVKGYVGSATVDVYQYVDNGQRGTLLASTSTDSRGNYSVSFNFRGIVEVVVSDGSYKDEASGTTVTLGTESLRNIVSIDQRTKTVAVTALTTIVAEHVNANAGAGIETAIANANAKVSAAFGLSGVDLTTVIPSDFSSPALGHSIAQLKYGVIQAGLSQLIKDQHLSADKVLELIQDIANDFSDGSFDGKKGAAALTFALSITPKEALTGMNTAIENYMNSASNKSGVALSSLSISVPKPN